jgi:hypothetical protein
MSLKKVGKTPKQEATGQEVPKNDIVQGVDEILKAFEPEGTNVVELVDNDPGPAFPDPVETPNHMSLHTNDFYENMAGGFAPTNELIENKEKPRKPLSKVGVVARPADDIDLEHLDESMIMDMPQIKASAFKIIDILDPKPKDKSIRFRWANYKNYVGGNLGKYLAIGFQVASVDDVDQKRTPIDASMVDGTQIKWYDVILIKINVIRLMELYKTNIIKSVNKLEKAKVKGLAEANRQFQTDLSSEPGAARAYNHYKQALGHDPVEFYQE